MGKNTEFYQKRNKKKYPVDSLEIDEHNSIKSNQKNSKYNPKEWENRHRKLREKIE